MTQFLLLDHVSITSLGNSVATSYRRGTLVSHETLVKWTEVNESYYCPYILDCATHLVYELGPRGLIKDFSYPSSFGLTHMLAFKLILSADVSVLVKFLSENCSSTGDTILTTLIHARIKGDI